MIGERFGYLVVIGKQPGPKVWICKCDCGRETVATRTYLVTGRKRSCGCLRAKGNHRTHGMAGTPEHKVWKGIIKRCTNPNSQDFAEYGARGITICPEWRNDFARFFAHIGPRPSPSHSIDRIDNNRGYEPGNVRWSTPAEQSNNRRRRRWAKRPNEGTA